MALAPPQALNGRPRKQLSDQLDRLDEVINGMEDYLPQAVAEAARDGIRQAFRDVMGELVREPDMLDALRQAIAPNRLVPATPNAFAKLKTVLRVAANKAITAVGRVVASVTALPHRALTAAMIQVQRLKLQFAGLFLSGLPLASILTAGLVVGSVVGLISYLAPHQVAALFSGLGASTTAMGLQTACWFRHRVRLASGF